MAIITLGANAITALPAGVGGKVLQVVNGSTSSQIGVTANNSADTGLTATITPSAVSQLMDYLQKVQVQLIVL
jgi:molybdopterin-binding protein